MTLQLEKRSTIFQKDKAASSNFNWHIPHPKIKTHTHTPNHPEGHPFWRPQPPPKKNAAPFFMDWNHFLGSHAVETRFFLLWLGEKIIGSHCEKKTPSRLFFEELRDSGDRNAAAAQALRRLVDGEGEMVQWLGPRCVGGWWLGGWMVAGYGYWRWLAPPPETNWEFTPWKWLNICGWKATFFWGCLGLFLGATCLFWGRQFQRLRKGFYFKTFINPQFFKQWVGIIGSAKGHHSEFHFKKGS